MTILVAPTVAVLGLIATFLVIRARYKEKQSLYETLRTERRAQIERARERAGATPTPTAEVVVKKPRRQLSSAVAGVAALVLSLMLVLLGVALAVAARSGSL